MSPIESWANGNVAIMITCNWSYLHNQYSHFKMIMMILMMWQYRWMMMMTMKMMRRMMMMVIMMMMMIRRTSVAISVVAASWALGTGRSLSTRPWAQPMGYCPSSWWWWWGGFLSVPHTSFQNMAFWGFCGILMGLESGFGGLLNDFSRWINTALNSIAFIFIFMDFMDILSVWCMQSNLLVDDVIIDD